MSFIGSLDQFDLSIILQKIEEYRKTGLLIVNQGETSVELAFQEGQLMCIGPVKPGVTLGERFARSGIIPSEACYSIELALGARYHNEGDAACAFLDASYVNEEGLRWWACNEASQVLKAVLSWEDGDLYFEENQLPSTDRFLVPLSITTLLSSVHPILPATTIVPDTTSPSPASYTPTPPSFSAAELIAPFTAVSEHFTDTSSSAMIAGAQKRVTDPLAPLHISVPFIQPGMTLLPADLTALRESNPTVTLTPEQWRLFTRANGETTLSLAAHELRMTPDQVCRIAFELQALGLVTVHQAAFAARDEIEMNAGMDAQYSLNSADVASNSTSAYRYGKPPIETQSQWGNGGNGATFQLGSGWVVTPTGSLSALQQYPEQEYYTAYAQAS